MKKIMLSLKKQDENTNKPCFDMWCSGTGAKCQIIDIIIKLYKSGFNLMADPELKNVFSVEYANGIHDYAKEIYDEIKELN